MLATLKLAAPLLAVAVTVLALLGAGYGAGHSVAGNTGAARLEAMRSQHAVALADAQRQARQTEQELHLAINEVQVKYQQLEEQAAHEKLQHDRLITDLRAGTQRLSIAVKGCSRPPANPADTELAGGSGSDIQRADIDPEAAAALISITRDGDQYTRERNACVAAYEAVKAKLNSQK